MVEMEVILNGLDTPNEGDADGLLFTASSLGLNSKRIWNLQYVVYRSSGCFDNYAVSDGLNI